MSAVPVSAALEADLRNEVRRNGVLVWLDADGHYSSFVDRLMATKTATELGFELRAFRGSHLALMLSLDGLAAGAEKVPLVIHLPGFNKERVRETPLFELYSAGKVHLKALETLITESAAGRVRPDRIAAFTSQPGATLESADAWLAAHLAVDGGGLGAQLAAMHPAAVFDALLTPGAVAAGIGQTVGSDDRRVLWERLAVWTGLPASWRDAAVPSPSAQATDIAFAAASWVLAVEYVHDLKRAPVNLRLAEASALPHGLIDKCRELAAYFRERHDTFYERTADETEALLVDEVEAARAEDLGKIDTFRFEEDKVLERALVALGNGEWAIAAEWAARRVNLTVKGASFWVKRDASRQAAWTLIHDAARLGDAIARAGERLPSTETLDAALDEYVARGRAVDQTHRHLEQRRAALLYPQLPSFDTLRLRLDDMRRRWRQWADGWSRDFNAICRVHGFLPSASQQQRTIFDEIVRPLTQEPGTTAYFMVDAFRFEMGEELYREIADTPATTAQLKARLAELPTVTEVGMNVLAPVAANGRLRPSLSTNDGGSILGFSTGEYRVFDAETRRRAMQARVGGAKCPWLTLDDVVSRTSTSLKQAIAQARLVIVHNREIDDAGEGGVGPSVFDHVMQKLRAAWHLLREAGVRRFVFTGDHGFLLLDAASGGPQPHGRRVDPKRRYVLSPLAADHVGEVRVSLAELGYEGVEGHVMFPETTAVFDTGKRSMTFAHGGNSLQERAVPVLTVVHRAASGGSTMQYSVSAHARDDVAGMHCLEVTVDVVAQGALDFGSAGEVELSLRVPEGNDVQVELCQTRGNARIGGGAVQAPVGESFEIFFRLYGASEERVRVEVFHSGAVAEVVPGGPDARFAVTEMRVPAWVPARPALFPPTAPASWLDALPAGGVRQIFEHLAVHGAITEQEATIMLGGARALRRFALEFETLAEQAPWNVRIDVVAGVKRYVREGSRR